MATVEGMATGEDSAAAAGGNRARRAAAAVLAAAFAVLLPVAVTSLWIRGTVLSTRGYVAAVTPVAASPAVRDTVRKLVTTQVDAALRHAEAALPPAARGLAGPLGTGLARLAGDRVSEFMASSAFRRLWKEVNRFAHRQVIGILSGDSRLVQARGGQVVLNLGPLVNEVLPGISGPLSSLIRKSSPRYARIPLFPAAALAGPRRGYRILIAVTWLVLAPTPLALASALAVSPRRRRTLLQLSISGTLILLATGIALSWGRSSLVARAVPRYHAVTSAIVHALTGGLFGLLTWCAVGCLAVAAVALLAGRFSPDGEPG
jgi:hypothetical protein